MEVGVVRPLASLSIGYSRKRTGTITLRKSSCSLGKAAAPLGRRGQNNQRWNSQTQ